MAPNKPLIDEALAKQIREALKNSGPAGARINPERPKSFAQEFEEERRRQELARLRDTIAWSEQYRLRFSPREKLFLRSVLVLAVMAVGWGLYALISWLMPNARWW